jgi:hypothetical protein
MASAYFHILLEERIREEGDKIREQLATGVALDYAEYKWNVGCLYGLKMCLKLCEDIEREFDERNNPASGS